MDTKTSISSHLLVRQVGTPVPLQHQGVVQQAVHHQHTEQEVASEETNDVGVYVIVTQLVFASISNEYEETVEQHLHKAK